LYNHNERRIEMTYSIKEIADIMNEVDRIPKNKREGK